MNIKHALTPLLLALTASLTLAGAAHAAPDEARAAAAKERVQSMTPEQKAAAKEKMRARWEAMSPEEQAAARKRMQERQPRRGANAADSAKGDAASR